MSLEYVQKLQLTYPANQINDTELPAKQSIQSQNTIFPFPKPCSASCYRDSIGNPPKQHVGDKNQPGGRSGK